MENNDFYWHKDIVLKNYEKLNEDISVDVAVIGGGISGVLCAYFLNEAGFNVTLFEQGKLYSGTTCHTTAHMTKIEDYIYQELIEYYGKDVALEYFNSKVKAIEKYDELIKRYNIDCDYNVCSSNFYTSSDVMKLEKEYQILSDFKDDVSFVRDGNIFGKKVKAILRSNNNRCFHPIKFLEGIPKEFKIYENTKVIGLDFEEKKLFTENNVVGFNYAVCATNFPFLKIKGLYSLKMYKCSSYNMYYKVSGNFNIDLYEDTLKNGFTYRSHNNNLIQGGLDYRCGEKTPHLEMMKLDIEKAFKDFDLKKFSYETSCDSVTFDGIPYIGRYVKDNEFVYLVTGFNKFGMLNAIVSAMEITSLIKNKVSLFNNIFSPQRKLISFSYLSKHLMSTIKGFVVSNVNFNHRCTHLGGRLFYNETNNTYECPCHGSRFNSKGKVIEGPANKDLI